MACDGLVSRVDPSAETLAVVAHALSIEPLVVAPGCRIRVERVRESDQIPCGGANIVRGRSVQTSSDAVESLANAVRGDYEAARVLAEAILGLVAVLSPASRPVG